MPTSNAPLLLEFLPADSVTGLTRMTVKAMAARLGASESQVVHLALVRLAKDILAHAEGDEGALTARQLAAIKIDAEMHLPKGKVLFAASLLP